MSSPPDGDVVDRRHRQPIAAATGGCTASLDTVCCSIENCCPQRTFRFKLRLAPPATSTAMDPNVNRPLRRRCVDRIFHVLIGDPPGAISILLKGGTATHPSVVAPRPLGGKRVRTAHGAGRKPFTGGVNPPLRRWQRSRAGNELAQ
jgi:hypothetical protein